MKKQTYKVTFDDLKKRYEFPDDIDQEIQKRVKKVNRTDYIPRRCLERRSLDFQAAYAEIMKYEKPIRVELQRIATERHENKKLYGLNSKEYKKLDKQFDNYCSKIGLASNEYSSYLDRYTNKFYVSVSALVDVLMMYEFN